MKKRIAYTPEFKAKIAINAIKENKTVAEISSEEKVDPKSIRDWKKEFIENSSIIFNRKKEILPYKDQLNEKDK